VTHPSWWAKLTPLVDDERFDKILVEYAHCKKNGINVFPEIGAMLNPFKFTIRSKLRVCILGQDPYPQRGKATGLAFANDPLIEGRLSPSLNIIIEELVRDLRINEFDFYDKVDLFHWTKQGVLLLNSALSVRENDIGSHSHLWRYFIKEVVDTLPRNVIKVAVGSKAKALMPNADVRTYHPAADIYSGSKLFRGSSVFTKINNGLVNNGLETINWE